MSDSGPTDRAGEPLGAPLIGTEPPAEDAFSGGAAIGDRSPAGDSPAGRTDAIAGMFADAEDLPGEQVGSGDAGFVDRLVDAADAAIFTGRFRDIQAEFVDDPRRAIADAESLMADVIERINEALSAESAHLEAGLDRGSEASTEDLRLGLQRYRDFFHRLLAA